MIKKRFASRLISIFSFVVFGGFLLVYLLFNQLMNNHIRSEASLALAQEIITITAPQLQSVVFPLMEANDMDIHQLQLFQGSRIRSNQAIVSVDSILLDENQQILHPSPARQTDFEARQSEALAEFWRAHQEQFLDGEEMVLVRHEGHSFYMRAAPFELISFATGPRTYMVLMFTDITPAMNLKNNMNQLLMVLLGASGLVTLASSIILSNHFKNAIRQLSDHAAVIGTGVFNEKLSGLVYAEFNDLAANMNHMADMLADFELKQKQFFQNASHELKTPLTSIQGYTEGIQAGLFADPAPAADIILAESRRMKALIDEILFLSKLSEVQDLPLEAVDLNKILKQAIARIYFHNLTVSIEASAGLTLKADAQELERGILNVLANASRHARSQIRIWTTVEQEVTIFISNDGEKIPKEDLPFLFDRFFKGKNGNTGLGLAITQEVVSKYGGKVAGRNNDEGVIFEISFPVSK